MQVASSLPLDDDSIDLTVYDCTLHRVLGGARNAVCRWAIRKSYSHLLLPLSHQVGPHDHRNSRPRVFHRAPHRSEELADAL